MYRYITLKIIFCSLLGAGVTFLELYVGAGLIKKFE